MNLALILALLLPGFPGLAADTSTLDATAAAQTPHPALIRLDWELTQKLKPGLDRATPEYKEFAAGFRERLDAAMENVPKTSANKGLHARLLVRLGGADGEQAESALQSELKRSPNDATLRAALAFSQAQRGDYPGAAASARAVLDMRPQPPKDILEEALYLWHANKDRVGGGAPSASPVSVAMPQPRGPAAASADDASKPYKLVVKGRANPGEVPTIIAEPEPISPAHRKGNGTGLLTAMAIAAGILLIAWGAAPQETKDRFRRILWEQPKQEVKLLAGAAAVSGIVYLGATFMPPFLTAMTSAAPSAPALTPALAGGGVVGGAVGGAVVLQRGAEGVVAAGIAVKVAATTAKKARDAISHAKFQLNGTSDPTEAAGGGEFLTPAQKDEIRRSWDRVTFRDEAASLRYHYNKHGEGQGWLRYTREARRFFETFRSSGRPTLLNSGRTGIKITANGKFGIFTETGRIVTYGPK